MELNTSLHHHSASATATITKHFRRERNTESTEKYVIIIPSSPAVLFVKSQRREISNAIAYVIAKAPSQLINCCSIHNDRHSSTQFRMLSSIINDHHLIHRPRHNRRLLLHPIPNPLWPLPLPPRNPSSHQTSRYPPRAIRTLHLSLWIRSPPPMCRYG